MPCPYNGTNTMESDPTTRHRRSLRLQGYDYRRVGACFITICARDRACLFGEVVGCEVRLNEVGAFVRACWEEIPAHFPNVHLDAFVIMPNHVHGIVWLVTPVGARHAVPLPRERFGRPLSGSIPTIVRSFKAAVTRRINGHRGTPGASVWQRNYYEHLIRDDESLDCIREYIANNPRQWGIDRENPAGVCSQDGPHPPRGGLAEEPWAV